MKSNKVIRLERSQMEKASQVSARAFMNDPMFSYLTPEAQQSRFKALEWLATEALECCFLYGHVYTTPELKGVAAWLPPERSSFGTIQLLQLIWQLRLYLLPFKCGWDKLERWLSLLKMTENYHQQDMATQSHWYLASMFVDPSCQGQGVGSTLLKPILRKASAEKLPCYVVTFTEQAVNFYQKNGFEVIRKDRAIKDAPLFWNLKRDI